MNCAHFLALTIILIFSTGAWAQIVPDEPKICTYCEPWNQPQRPFRIYGNTYYVGTTRLSAILIDSDDGLVLVDAALPQSVPLIDANIRELGFKTSDIRLIITSHAHYDHVGGVAAIQRASQAEVVASPKSAAALNLGRPTEDDPQFDIADNGFPPVDQVSLIEDGEMLVIGNTKITAHFTPGHTPGSTSWSWQSCEGDSCLDVVYADSLNAVSAEGFRYTGSELYRSRTERFLQSIQTLSNLSCDILLSPHPGFFEMSVKLKQLEAGQINPFIDKHACAGYAASAGEGLSQRIQRELAPDSEAD